jgi:hypothetical protein
VYLDGRPRLTVDVADGENSFPLPATTGTARLELRGYKEGSLAASTRLPVFAAAPSSPVV